MKVPALASKLTVWSHRRFSYEEAKVYAERYKAGTLGEGFIKDFFDSLDGPQVIPVKCKIPTCSNQTTCEYCEPCTNMIPGSAVVELLRELTEFLSNRGFK